MRRTAGLLGLLSGCVLVTGLGAQDTPKKPAADPAAVFKFADSNADDKLSLDEFLKLTARSPALKDKPDQAKQLFAYLDANGDGFLSLEEYRKVNQLQGKEPESKPMVEKPPTPEQLAFFEKKIRPVLVEHCYQCHSAETEKLKGGLLLDTRAGIRKGGDTGPAVVPGSLEKSLLIKAIRYRDDKLQMPPKQQLTDEVVADFERWVRMGAPDPRDGVKVARSAIDIEKGRQFWAFQPPRKAPPPTVKDSAWPGSDIDRFLLAGLEAKGLKPVGDADRYTLLRRVYFDLVGLPPSPAEVEAFVQDTAADAFAKVVDRLLASPQYGERWGRHWLDVARYAESSGKEVNFNYPHAWRYRDYVLASFHADKPYDRFIREQLAGDLLPAADDRQRAEQQIATGFLAIGPKSHNERLPLQFQLDVADEQIDATTQVFLGLTAACARCHDHKFDPIPQHDYYALTGIFRSTETCYGTIRIIQNNQPSSLIALPSGSGQPAALERLSPEARTKLNQQIEEVRQERNQLAKEGKLFTTREGVIAGARLATMEARLALFDDDGNPKAQAMGVRERSRPLNSPLYARGEMDKPGEVVPRGLIQVVSRKPPAIAAGSGRRELAEWLASPDNPLTARVMVNRVWLHLFGRGLVATPDNFGASGQPPSHPELLDYLAVSFRDNGWSVKQLIRRIVLSRAYQLSSKFDARNNEADPDNVLVWRMSKRRLDAEALRDAILSVSGTLNLKPPVGSLVAQTGEGNSNFLQRFTAVEARFVNRSVYLPLVRNQLPESLALFDGADPSLIVGERPSTSVPAQGLYLLNNPLVLGHADAAAARLMTDEKTDRDRIRVAYLRCYGRPPDPEEVQAAEAFLAAYAKTLAQDKVPPFQLRRATWASFCQALFGSADFLYRN